MELKSEHACATTVKSTAAVNASAIRGKFRFDMTAILHLGTITTVDSFLAQVKKFTCSASSPSFIRLSIPKTQITRGTFNTIMLRSKKHDCVETRHRDYTPCRRTSSWQYAYSAS